MHLIFNGGYVLLLVETMRMNPEFIRAAQLLIDKLVGGGPNGRCESATAGEDQKGAVYNR